MTFEFPAPSRHGGGVDRFVWFVEQLEESIRLLQTNRVALQRMALVALDTLAEALLYRHKDLLFYVSDEHDYQRTRAYTATERRKAREEFNKRVELAAEDTSELSWGYPPPILDRSDAEIFRVAHRYRNPVHHEDRHNPTLLPVVAALYAQAIGRAFVRSQRQGLSTSLNDSQRAALDGLGWTPDGEESLPGPGPWFTPAAAAKVIINRLTSDLHADANSVRQELADDIVYRCECVVELIDGLRSDGLELEKIERLILDAQDWAATRGDETLLSLRAEHDALAAKLRGRGKKREAAEQLRKIDLQIWEHLFGTSRPKIVRVTVDSVHTLKSKGDRLRGWKGGVPDLLSKYQRLDRDLELLEDAVDFVVSQHDRAMQHRLDVLRGK